MAAVVTGHVLAVISAHDRAVALLPRRRAIVGQLPMLVLMVFYTFAGLALLSPPDDLKGPPRRGSTKARRSLRGWRIPGRDGLPRMAWADTGEAS